MLKRIDQFIQKASKVLSYMLEFAFLAIFIFILYMAIIYPSQIASKTELGMTKSEVEQVYKGKRYRYENDLPKCTIGCDYNTLLPDKPEIDDKTKASIKTYMIVWTGIDGIFIVGFNENDTVIFASGGDT